jgi:hypothetical protein
MAPSLWLYFGTAQLDRTRHLLMHSCCSAGMSGAGLYESVPNVPVDRPEDVSAAVAAVWSSLFTRRAILSRRFAGMPRAQGSFATAVQLCRPPGRSVSACMSPSDTLGPLLLLVTRGLVTRGTPDSIIIIIIIRLPDRTQQHCSGEGRRQALHCTQSGLEQHGLRNTCLWSVFVPSNPDNPSDPHMTIHICCRAKPSPGHFLCLRVHKLHIPVTFLPCCR